MKIYDVVLVVIRALVLVDLIREAANLLFGGVGLAIYFSGLDSAHIPVTGPMARAGLTTSVLEVLAPIAISLFLFAISRRLAGFIVRATVPNASAT